jgi:hypothetical protein
MKFVAKSIALAALVVVTSAQSYAEPLRSTSIPSSLAGDEKRLMPKVMSEFYGTFDKREGVLDKHEVWSSPATWPLHVARTREHRQ